MALMRTRGTPLRYTTGRGACCTLGSENTDRNQGLQIVEQG